MVPHLKVFSDSQNIFISKSLIYDNESNSTADIIFFIQKQIGGAYVNLYMNHLAQPMFNDGHFVFIRFTSMDRLKDTIDLKNWLPFEFGNYRIQISLRYSLNGVKY